MNVYQQYLSYGLSVIPVKDKIPCVPSWKQYMKQRATNEEAGAWNNGVAIICGDISGGLLCIDFDVKNGDRYGDWLQLIDSQTPEVLSKLVIEQTPSGGYHVIFRSPLKIGNLKLAMNPEGAATIETRGEGGYFACAPTTGYKLDYSSFEQINTVTAEQAEIMINAAKALNEKHEKTVEYKQESYEPRTGLSPFDDFNTRHGVKEMLEQHGWRMCRAHSDKEYYTRPGKQRGISASYNAIPGRFFCFTSSTIFEQEKTYTAAAVYAVLNFNGDFKAAAQDLMHRGYGRREQRESGQWYSGASAKIFRPSAMAQRLIEIRDKGMDNGISTGWNNLDNYYRVVPGQMTIVTGYPSHGKSAFIDNLSVNLTLKYGWNFAVFSPENYPLEIHYRKICSMLTGKYLKDSTNDDIITAEKIVSQHYTFMDSNDDGVSLQKTFQATEILVQQKKINGLIIDPWNELEIERPRDMSPHEYIGECLKVSRKFARKHNIHLWILAHPRKPMPDKNGQYPVPDMYSIEGSSHWRNKADNGLTVYRVMEEGNEHTQIHIQKIKYNHVGQMGTAYMKYDMPSGKFFAEDPMMYENVYRGGE